MTSSGAKRGGQRRKKKTRDGPSFARWNRATVLRACRRNESDTIEGRPASGPRYDALSRLYLRHYGGRIIRRARIAVAGVTIRFAGATLSGERRPTRPSPTR